MNKEFEFKEEDISKFAEEHPDDRKFFRISESDDKKEEKDEDDKK